MVTVASVDAGDVPHLGEQLVTDGRSGRLV